MRPFAVLLLALFVVACGPTSQVVGTPTPAPSNGPPTDEPTFGPTVAPFGSFTRLDTFPTTGAFEVTDATSTANGFVVVGFGGLGGDGYYGRRQGIVWRSVDGASWSEAVDPSLANVTPYKVVARGSDLFIDGYLSACGDLEDTCTDLPQAGNGVWRSTSGGPWTLLAQAPDMQNGVIDTMLLAGDRLMALGGAGENQTSTVWTSSDGISWTATTDLAGMDPVSSVSSGPAGLSAFGTQYSDSSEDVVLIAASSTDGVHFSAASAPSITGAGIDALAAGPAGMVGVGYRSSQELEQDGVAVNSSDGLTWHEATNSDGSFAGSALQTVAALGSGGYVAVGYTPHPDDATFQDVSAWFSADGLDWQRIAVLAGNVSLLSTSALGAPGLVVFAAEQADLDNGDLSSVIHAWFAPLSSLHR